MTIQPLKGKTIKTKNVYHSWTRHAEWQLPIRTSYQSQLLYSGSTRMIMGSRLKACRHSFQTFSIFRTAQPFLGYSPTHFFCLEGNPNQLTIVCLHLFFLNYNSAHSFSRELNWHLLPLWNRRYLANTRALSVSWFNRSVFLLCCHVFIIIFLFTVQSAD